MFWTKIEGKAKKIVANITCNGTQLLWIIGEDNKVKHKKYNRNFDKLTEWTEIKNKDNQAIKALDISVNLDSNDIQTLFVVNDDNIMQLKYDSNNVLKEEVSIKNTGDKKLVKISTAINALDVSKTYALDQFNRLYKIDNIENNTTLSEPLDNVTFKEISNGIDKSGSEFLWGITEGDNIFYKNIKQKLNVETTINPDVQNYINRQLNKYANNQSLPTLTELKALETLKDNQTAEQISEIPKMLKDFKNQTKNYVDFHKDYETNLQQLLDKHLDVKKGINSKETELNEKKILDIKKQVDILKNQLSYETSESGKGIDLIKNKIDNGSFRNLSNGRTINFKNDKSVVGQNDSGNDILSEKHIKLLVNGKKEFLDKETNKFQIDPANKGDGCLGYDMKDGAIIRKDCEDNQDFNLSFKISNVKNVEDYNNLLDKMPKEWKTRVSEYDKITYPFSVIEPINNSGYCVDYDDEEKLRVLPCYNTQSQRFKVNDYQIKGLCKAD